MAYIRADVNNLLQLSWCWWLVNVKIATEITHQTLYKHTMLTPLMPILTSGKKYKMPLQIYWNAYDRMRGINKSHPTQLAHVCHSVSSGQPDSQLRRENQTLRFIKEKKRLFHYFWFPSVLSLPFHNSCFGSFSFSAQTGFFGKWLPVLWGSILTQKGGNFMFRIWDLYLMKGYPQQIFNRVNEYKCRPQNSLYIFELW